MKPVRMHVAEFDDETLRNLLDAIEACVEQGQNVLPVTINSGGGDVFSAFAMCDLIRSAPIQVATIALGHAQSAGSLLLAAGTRGMRYVAPNVTVMAHEVSTTPTGTLTTMEAEAEANETKRINRQLCALLDEFTKKPRRGGWQAKLRKLGNANYVMNAEQALAYGFADIIGVPIVKVRTEIDIILPV
jgi:ATP-dependent Clp protease protease subunit